MNYTQQVCAKTGHQWRILNVKYKADRLWVRLVCQCCGHKVYGDRSEHHVRKLLVEMFWIGPEDCAPQVRT